MPGSGELRTTSAIASASPAATMPLASMVARHPKMLMSAARGAWPANPPIMAISIASPASSAKR
jgi:hypothetical protein